ncbi:MAG: hypothetical protein NZ992_01220 [Candidatus Korarchaeum sp.]|nr:hypothetical protein [Candidatus Korarchaeum sp.]MDW8036325.1 hypothetical protein [Candidatus Korarchaeum sp.]
MALDRITDALMSKGFLIKRRGDGKIEAELGDEKVIIDPLSKAWIYIRGEGKGIFAKAFFSLEGILENIDNLRS